jgi:TfoX/Sxy family transcriptional regulator of competence genes
MKIRSSRLSDRNGFDEKLAQRVREALRATPRIAERRMFGGLAFLVGGRMCCGIVGHDLMVRVASDELDAVLQRRYVRPMDFTGKPLKGFVYVSPQAFRTEPSLRAWLDRGLRFVLQQPRSSKSVRSTRS